MASSSTTNQTETTVTAEQSDHYDFYESETEYETEGDSGYDTETSVDSQIEVNIMSGPRYSDDLPRYWSPGNEYPNFKLLSDYDIVRLSKEFYIFFDGRPMLRFSSQSTELWDFRKALMASLAI